MVLSIILNAMNLLAPLTRHLISELAWYVQQSTIIKIYQIHIYPFQIKLYTLLEPHLTFYFESNIILLKCRHMHVFSNDPGLKETIQAQPSNQRYPIFILEIHAGLSRSFQQSKWPLCSYFLWNWDSAHDNGKKREGVWCWMDGEE